MTYSFRPAKREGVQLMIGIAGPSAAGKTLSALKLAKGLSDRKPFVFVDTESGRALHYADDFDFLHTELTDPFEPARYSEVIAEAAAQNPPVIVVDSMSHEHAGPGGVLMMHEAELDRLAGDDYKKRESYNMSAWKRPKAERKLLISDLLRLRCHLILCFRAEEKVDIIPDPQKPGKTKIVPKRTVAGHVGWIPVCGKEYPYELTISMVVTPERPGVPHMIKIMDAHRPFFPDGEQISEEAGVALGRWAAGGASAPATPEPAADASEEIATLTARLVGASSDPEKAAAKIEAKRQELGATNPAFLGWLVGQEARLPRAGTPA